MTVAEVRKMLEALPDDMLVFMYVDEENVLSVSDIRSDIEEVVLEHEQISRVFIIRTGHVTDGTLRIPKTILKNLQ
jgi:two-component SAPR family response regulator